MTQAENKKTSLWRVVLFWLYVAVPLVWGITQTLKKAMALFT
ncbi:MAG: MFS transporter small subunit [Gammaproteobacteria bacterium]